MTARVGEFADPRDLCSTGRHFKVDECGCDTLSDAEYLRKLKDAGEVAVSMNFIPAAPPVRLKVGDRIRIQLTGEDGATLQTAYATVDGVEP